MTQSQVTEVDVVKESVRHNEKSIDALTSDFKEFRKEINTKLDAINNKFVTLYAMIAVSILLPIAIAVFQGNR